jgi:hypothetical protein
MSDSVKADVRKDVKNILEQETRRNNTNNNHHQQMVELLREKNCYYTKVNKSNAVVIMDKN